MTRLPIFTIAPLRGNSAERRKIAEQIATHVAFEIPPLYEEKDPSGTWTHAIRSVLRALKPFTWDMYPPLDASPAGEFLVDACWWVERSGAALVAEFEWGEKWKDILKDFEKIVVIKSPFKLMIHHASRGEVSSREIELQFKQYLTTYSHHLEGETYIFIEYLPKEHVRAFMWQPTKDGPAESIAFDEIFSTRSFIRKWKLENSGA